MEHISLGLVPRFSASRGNYSAAVIRNTQGAPLAAETTDRILGEGVQPTS